ncbi:MAG: DUF4102 domain-containing protein [Rhodocyclaceae bacterium]|nr:MAG: DUF4102 domain-containing protein [Rhodocyclaceae bacterium]
MARINLTAGRIREFSTDKVQAFLWDTEAPGLAVRATSSGAKSFVFQGKLAGATIRVTIGEVRAWGIDEARAEARRLQTLLDRDIDPRAEKAERLAAVEAKRAATKRQSATFGQAWAAYVAKMGGRWSPRHLADHEKMVRQGGEKRKRGPGTTTPGPLASLVPMKLSDLNGECIAQWLDDESAKRPTQAALAFRLLRAFMRWAAETKEYAGVVSVSAVGARVAKDHLPKPRAKDGDCLQREQLAAWFTEVQKLPTVVSAYLQTALLVGARREELAGMRWDDVDFKWRSLTIHDKVDGERTIPLTPYLAKLLANLKRLNDTPPSQYRILRGKRIENDLRGWKPSPWVFASDTSKSGHLAEPRAAHVKALTTAGLPHVSLHGLRRSFGTLAEWAEAPTGVVAQIMGHKPSAIAEKHYRRRALDFLRKWHDRIEEWILEQAGIEQPKPDEKGDLRLVSK